jgi:predicted XRE-type DNA-binding protein
MGYLRSLIATATDQCIIWQRSTTAAGYGQVHHEGHNQNAHRIVCIQTHGEPPFFGAHAAHLCGVPQCVNPRHLRWATPAENSEDRKMHGTYICGEAHPQAKLTTEQVAAIRHTYANEGLTQRTLAWWFGVSQPTISAIVNGKGRVAA